MFDKPIFTYIGMGLAVVAMVFGVVKPDWANIAWTIASVLGFGSVAALRTFIDSKGWKTYAVFVVTVVLAGAQAFNWITPEQYQALMVVFAPIIAMTTQQALAKSPTSTVPKVK
jgi:hypothetical protein